MKSEYKKIITLEADGHQSVAVMEAAEEMLTFRVLSQMYEGNMNSTRQFLKGDAWLIRCMFCGSFIFSTCFAGSVQIQHTDSYETDAIES